MLVKRRKELHEATARQIEALFNSHLEDHYAALAHHYSCSGNNLKALEYLQLAAQQAIQRSANAEAINQLNAAMQFLNTLPETPQRDRQELALLTMLGPALIATKGNGAPEVGAVYQRALQLGRQSGEDARLFPVLFGLRSFHLIRGELQPAFALGQQLLSLAEDARDPDLLVEAQASKKMGEAVAVANRQSHAFSLAVAVVHTIVLSYLRSEWRKLHEQAEMAIAFCTEQRFGAILAQASSYRGYALAQQGQTDKALPSCAQVWMLNLPPRRSCSDPGIFVSWRMPTERQDALRKGWMP